MNDAFEDGVGRAFRGGRAQWPAIVQDAAAFELHLRSLEVTAEQLAAHGGDLYLATACGAGDPAACEIFDQTVLGRMELYVAQFSLSASELDELKQTLRIELLAGAVPKIRSYRGRGPLGAWVRVIAVRHVIMQRRAAGRQPNTGVLASELGLGARTLTATDRLTRDRHMDEFQAALTASLARLEPREKTLLYMSVVDGMSIDALARVFQVHRATAARWLVTIRNKVYRDVRHQVAAKDGMSSAQWRSVLRVVHDDLSISLSHLNKK